MVGARVLDVFAGSGALGVEAISRGARWALFVEEDAGAVRVLLGNLERLGLIDPTEVRARAIEVLGQTVERVQRMTWPTHEANERKRRLEDVEQDLLKHDIRLKFSTGELFPPARTPDK